MKAGEYGQFLFTAPAAGDLKIKPSGTDTDLLSSFQYRLFAEDPWTDAVYDQFSTFDITVSGLEAGLMYTIQNTRASEWENNTFTFNFKSGGEQGGEETGGEGTLENPWVVKAGEELTVDIPMFGMGYAEFTPEVNGHLTLTRTAGFVGINSCTIQPKDGGAVMSGELNAGSYSFSDELKAGTTYIITFDCSMTFDNVKNTYRFDYKESVYDPNAFKVVSADPEAGSTIESITYDKPITVILNRTREEIGNLQAEFTENSHNITVTFVSEDTEEGTSTWTVGPTDMSDVWGEDYVSTWTLMEGTTYTLTLSNYPEGQSSQGGTPTEVCSIKYEGATKPEVLSEISLINITPYGDEMLSSDGTKAVTVEFDGKVEVKSFGISEGQMGSISLTYDVEYTEEGHTIVTSQDIDMTENDAVFTFNIEVVDEEGHKLAGNTTYSDINVANGIYSFTINCKDGRWVSKLLEATDIEPRQNAYLEELGKVTFTMSKGLEESYYLTRAANAGIYNAEDEKVYDVVLSQDDERAAEEFESEDMEFGGTTEYFPGTTGYMIATVYPLGTVTDNVAADGTEPAAITTPGVYTLKIDEQSIGDAQFDIDYPWMGPLGSKERGRCNPEYNWTFNVVEKIVEVESVDPAPYNVSGEYNEKVPAEVSVKFNDANVTVENVVAMVSPFNSAILTEDDYKLEDGVLTMSIPESMLAERKVTVTVEAVSSEGQPVTYGYTAEDIDAGLSGIMLVYQTPQDVLVPTAVTPEDKSTVSSLADIVLTFGENLGIADSEGIELRDAAGQPVAYGVAEVNFDEEAWAATSLTIRLDDVIDAEGTYTLVIPAENFYNEDESVWNPALEYTFTVDPTFTGISGINVSADEEVKVYTVSGVYVGAGKAGDVLGKLSKGIYIVNGQKVAIK